MCKAEHRSLAGGQPAPPYLCLVFTTICLTAPGAWAPPLTFWTACAGGRLGSLMRRSPPTDTCGSVILGTLTAALFSSPRGLPVNQSAPEAPCFWGLGWELLFGESHQAREIPSGCSATGPWIHFSGPSLCQVQKLPCLHQDLSPHMKPRGRRGLEHGPHSSPTWLSSHLGWSLSVCEGSSPRLPVYSVPASEVSAIATESPERRRAPGDPLLDPTALSNRRDVRPTSLCWGDEPSA